jgi:hypothetical protein
MQSLNIPNKQGYNYCIAIDIDAVRHVIAHFSNLCISTVVYTIGFHKEIRFASSEAESLDGNMNNNPMVIGRDYAFSV